MVLFLRCSFILALLGTAALGDAHARGGKVAGYVVGEGAARAGRASEDAVSIRQRSGVLGRERVGELTRAPRRNEEDGKAKLRLRPRTLGPVAPGQNCSDPDPQHCESSTSSCRGDTGVCSVERSAPSPPKLPQESSSDPAPESEGEEEDVEKVEVGGKGKDKSPDPMPEAKPLLPPVKSKELEHSIPHQNQNANQQEQVKADDDSSQPQAGKLASEVSKAPEGHVGTPATPESSGSSEGKDGAKGGNEIPLSTEQKHGSITNEESAKSGARESEVTDGSSEKGEDENPSRQRGIASHPNKDKRGESAAAEASNIPFREKTSVVLLVAVFSCSYT
ncbi:hypothetical protein ERJ75_001582000 [Trypanosoma vivax]|nr:hypothetical protein TRVL_08446 [Trypanosoma vivax]KAH8605722.1 hypothetical protein ERJ75_001582000 [Trypanosoma vivax]